MLSSAGTVRPPLFNRLPLKHVEQLSKCGNERTLSFRWLFSFISRLKWLQWLHINKYLKSWRRPVVVCRVAFIEEDRSHTRPPTPAIRHQQIQLGQWSVSRTNSIPVSHPARQTSESTVYLETDGKAAGRNFRNVPIHVVGKYYTSLCEPSDLQHNREVAQKELKAFLIKLRRHLKHAREG